MKDKKEDEREEEKRRLYSYAVNLRLLNVNSLINSRPDSNKIIESIGCAIIFTNREGKKVFPAYQLATSKLVIRDLNKVIEFMRNYFCGCFDEG